MKPDYVYISLDGKVISEEEARKTKGGYFIPKVFGKKLGKTIKKIKENLK